MCPLYLIDERVPNNAIEALIAEQQYHRLLTVQLCNATDKSDLSLAFTKAGCFYWENATETCGGDVRPPLRVYAVLGLGRVGSRVLSRP